MADVESPERLPIGWTEKVDTKDDGEETKFYFNVITGMKFSSKADLLRYVELGIPSQNTRQQTRAQKEGNTENRLMLMTAETNHAPYWLPEGWLVELNATSNGQKYKRYIDPSTGRKFYSRPSILKYVNSDECNDPALKAAMSIGYDIKLHGESSGADTPPKAKWSQIRQFEIVRYEAIGLPPGWIKEIKIQKTGDKIRKDPYFTDPESKYVFRSLPDALRYVETKNINACIMKPRKREELKFLSDDISIPEESQSLDITNKDWAENEANHPPTSDQPPRTPVSKRKQGNPLAAPSTDNIMQQEKPIKAIIDSANYERKKPRTGELSGAETHPKMEGSQTRNGTINASIQRLMSSSLQKSFEIVRFEAEGLPPGWIKEIKIERTGDKIRKDPFFTDPKSNYVFRSLPDALRYLETKNLKACAIKPRKREDLKFLSDDISMPEEKQLLDNIPEECAENEENHLLTSDQPPRTPASKRKQGKPIASPSTDNITLHQNPAEVVTDSTKYEGRQVIGDEKSREPQPFERLGGESSLDPCLEFAFKTLRSDVPVEASNLAAQSYNHHQRASYNLGFASFSNYARQ